MPGAELIRKPAEFAADEKFDRVIVVDSGSLSRIGAVESLLAQDAVIVNIDHHRSNDQFGKINIVHPRCAACGELLYFLFRELGVDITPTMAMNLFSGILTDTGRFRHSNTTSVSLHVAAELAAHGADVSRITEQLYYGIPADDVRRMGLILSSVELHGSGRISTMLVPLENAVEDPDNIADLARAIRGVEVAALFSEMADGKIRVSLRSNATVNVAEIATKFGGGGHERAAGFRVSGTLRGVRDRVLPTLLEAVGVPALPLEEKHA
jgi:phosphoesterase RecJ-like protein